MGNGTFLGVSPHLKVHAFGLFQCIEEALKGLAKVIKPCDFIRFEFLQLEMHAEGPDDGAICRK